MAGIMDTIKNATNDGALLSLGAVALVAGLGAANQAGFYNKLPGGVKLPGVGSSNDDAWWGEGQGQGQGQWEGFGQEFEDYGSYNGGGSRSKGSKKKKGSKRKASAYNQFVGQRIPQLIAQGYASKDAMKVAAKEWSSGGGW